MTKGNELILYGSVGYNWWDEDFFTAKGVRDALAGMSGDITVRINSGGGVASEGQAIYTALVDYPGKKTVIVDSVAASAASLIAMAGDEILIRRGAFMLIHDPATPWTLGRGTEEDHRKEADLLAVIANAYADIYAHRAGMTREEARRVMVDETYLDGPMALEMGFATAIEDDEAVAAAVFDYRIYAHAPAHLRDRAEKTLGRVVPGRSAVMAMIAGHARPTLQGRKEATMAETKTTAVEDPTADKTNADTSTGAVPAEVPAAAPGGEDAVATALAAERARARRITEAVAAARLPATMAAELIGDDKMTVEMALDRITATWKETGDVDTPMIGRPTATITRDERDTKRAGMVAALTARMSRQAPQDERARPFMDLSLVEMAAEAIGHKGPIRSTQDRLDVVQMAMHSTSDLPFVLENALNKRLAAAYEMQAPTYRRIADQIDFTDFRPHPVSNVSDFPAMTTLAEGGEIKFGTLSDKRETVSLTTFASGLILSRQMIVNDDLGAIDRIVRRVGTSAAQTEENAFWTMFNQASGAGPTLTETGRAMFNTTDGTLAAAAAAITEASLDIARSTMRKRKTLGATAADQRDLEVVPTILLVGPDRQMQAERMVLPIVAAQSSNINVFTGSLQVVVTAKITGNAWYLFADPALVPNFVYGYLDGSNGPMFRIEQPFGRDGTGLSLVHDFGCGGIDWRGGFRNAGA